MDPQKPADLDPKLKEVYERVMGTTIPQATSTAPQPQPQTTQPITTPQAPMPTTTTDSPIDLPKSPVTAFVAKPSQPGLGFPLPLPLLIFLMILFFLGYALFWIKFFKVNLPFLPL